MIARRSFLTGLASLFAAPAVIRTPGLLMPVKGWATPLYGMSPALRALEDMRLLNVRRFDFLENWQSLALEYLPGPANYVARHLEPTP